MSAIAPLLYISPYMFGRQCQGFRTVPGDSRCLKIFIFIAIIENGVLRRLRLNRKNSLLPTMAQGGKRPDAATTIELYRSMLRIRLAEQRITEVYPTDQIQSPIHLSVGQEAITTGVCRAL